jgi:hypothetical protein
MGKLVSTNPNLAGQWAIQVGGSDIEMQGLERRGLKGTGCGCACVIDWAIVGCGS